MGKRDHTSYTERIKIGSYYGNWEVMSSPFIKYSKPKDFKKKDGTIVQYDVRQYYVNCKCSCGSLVDVYCDNLLNGKSKRCYTCSIKDNEGSNSSVWAGYEEIPGQWFKRYKYPKDHKKYRTITIEEVWDLYLKQNRKCFLSGLDISFYNIGTPQRYSCTASLDRIDSSLGYTLENCQLVHKDVNLMKNHFEQNYFIDICKKIANLN
jgi:hypothetical protein